MKNLTLIRVLEFQVNFVSAKKVLIVTSMEVAGQESRQLGSPVSLDDSRTPTGRAREGGALQQQQPLFAVAPWCPLPTLGSQPASQSPTSTPT